MSNDEKYGEDRATILVDDWYEMFEWSQNPLYKEAMIDIIKKYDKNVVQKAIRGITMELSPKYLPTLAKIDQALVMERLNQKRNQRDTATMDELARSSAGGDVQKQFIQGLKRLCTQLRKNVITKEEFYRKQGDFFKHHNKMDDANFFYENADRVKKGLPKISPESWERSHS